MEHLERSKSRRLQNIKHILNKYCVRGCELDSTGSDYGLMACSVEHSKEPWVTIKSLEISGLFQYPKKASARWN